MKQKVLLEGCMYVSTVNTEKYGLFKKPSTTTLPGDVFVDCCLISLPEHGSKKLPVLLRNETEQNIILPTNCIIVDLAVVDSLLENRHVVDRDDQKHVVECSTHQAEAKYPVRSFDFGPSLPGEWTERESQQSSVASLTSLPNMILTLVMRPKSSTTSNRDHVQSILEITKQSKSTSKPFLTQA